MRSIIICACMILLAMVTPSADGAFRIDPEAKYMLINVHSGHALDVMDSSKEPGIELVQSKRDKKNPSQHWKVEKTNTGYKLSNVQSKLVIDVAGGSKAPGERLIQYTDQGGPNQQWLMTLNNRNIFVIRSAHSNLVMTVDEASTEPGAQIKQFPWLISNAQLWELDKVR